MRPSRRRRSVPSSSPATSAPTSEPTSAVLAAKLTDDHWGHLLPMLVDAAARDPEILELQRRTTAERRAAAMAIAANGVATGQIRPDVDLELVSEMLVGPLFTRHLITHLPITEDLLDELINTVFRLIGTPD